MIDVNTLPERRLTVISGLAGSGKSVAIRALEDLGWYCIDNLPTSLIPNLLSDFSTRKIPYSHVALALDSRDPELPPKFSLLRKEFEATAPTEILFFEARDEILVKRFRETRRLHPLTYASLNNVSQTRSLLDAIRKDRQILVNVRTAASKIVDTSDMTSHYLKQFLTQFLAPTGLKMELLLKVMSFGFKHGIPADLDMVFDARCFRNPHYDPVLRPMTGLDEQVKNFVLQESGVSGFIEHIFNFLNNMYPNYSSEGKRYLGVGIGCTGGKHRSVAIAEELGRRLTQVLPSVCIEHRHVGLE